MTDSRYLTPDERNAIRVECEEDREGFHYLLASHAAADEMLAEALNYIEQAQIIVSESSRKGASVLHGIGDRLARRIDDATGGGASRRSGTESASADTSSHP